MSLPAPPVRVSAPASPLITSLPAPPLIISAPAPPLILSLPAPPVILNASVCVERSTVFPAAPAKITILSTPLKWLSVVGA